MFAQLNQGELPHLSYSVKSAGILRICSIILQTRTRKMSHLVFDVFITE